MLDDLFFCCCCSGESPRMSFWESLYSVHGTISRDLCGNWVRSEPSESSSREDWAWACADGKSLSTVSAGHPRGSWRLGLTVCRLWIHPNKLSIQSVSLLLWEAGYANISPNVLPHLVSPRESPRPRVSDMSAEQESQHIDQHMLRKQVTYYKSWTVGREVGAPRRSPQLFLSADLRLW